MRISDWSSDVCSSDLSTSCARPTGPRARCIAADVRYPTQSANSNSNTAAKRAVTRSPNTCASVWPNSTPSSRTPHAVRSEEHTSELQSLMRISYAVFCLKKKNHIQHNQHQLTTNTLNLTKIH